ncbi:MAG: hypothetical protein PF485_11515 [Bacteroidales bacterium]|jgi:uncharacterized protein Smg (DUF494 family)|nr:hypothetical protein [Bacteroidales bacterium]
MKYLEIIENEKLLCSTLEGKAQLRDMIYFIIDYVINNKKLPPDSFRNDLVFGIGVRRSKIDETIKALDLLAKKKYAERMLKNPFDFMN